MFRTSPLAGLAVVFSCVVFSACSTLPARERFFDPSLCNKSAAYEAGYNDGLDGRAMGSSFLDGCREDLRGQGQEGYRTGYETGRQRFDERMKAMSANPGSQDPLIPQPPVPPPGSVNVNNGVQINFGQLGGPAPANPKAWFCSVQAFTSTFEAFGPTQLEAHQRALQDCVRQNNPMHCEDIRCRVNQ